MPNMTKRVRMPKCPKTVSGKHFWITEERRLKEPTDYKTEVKYRGLIEETAETEVVKITPYCDYCGLIDDTKKHDR